MNKNHLKILCQHFNMGVPKQEPQRVYGGLLHRMWRVDTENGSYAVKQLSQDIELTNEKVVKNYELSEHIASRFIKKGIPAVCAIEKLGKYLFIIDDTGFLVYPWVDAKALDKDKISEFHALEMARILSKMHALNLTIQVIVDAEFDIHPNSKIISLINLVKKNNLSIFAALENNLSIILNINERYHKAISVLNGCVVISHGDLDQKNVLWNDDNNPILIDWESARKLNPTYEMVNAALDWSGITTRFDKKLFTKMLQTYKKEGGVIDDNVLEAAFYGVLGNWINWMVYNIQRASNTENLEQQKMGIEQVILVLPTILRLL